jgi:thioredoxin reductase (NADPH)
MTTESTHPLVIIGSGPAGLTAALYAGRGHITPLVIEGGEPGGQLMGTSIVENWPGTSSILGPTLMLEMRKQAQLWGAQFLSESVVSVDFAQQPLKITTDRQTLYAHAVIIATGASPHTLGCTGEKEYWGKGVTTCAVCDGVFYKDKKVIVVGGGDTAMENASFLRKFTDNITILQISDRLTASAAMQERVIHDPSIKILYNSTVTSINGDGSHVTEAQIHNTKTQADSCLDAEGIFISIGIKPNTAPFKDHIALDSYGYIQVQPGSTQTSTPGVFAAGDVQDYRYRQAIVSAGSGCMAALDVERFLHTQGKK